MASNVPDAPPSANPAATTTATRLRNLIVTVVAIALSVSIFLGLGTETSLGTLQALAETSTPLDEALHNGKPSLMEFYADWCTSCQAMAKDIDALKQDYGDRVNFVMLNVDNDKWLPEMTQHKVDGIPQFVFLNPEGQAIASTIGEQPKAIMAANLNALALDQTLPYTQNRGRISDVEAPAPKAGRSDVPRSPGSQVVSPS